MIWLVVAAAVMLTCAAIPCVMFLVNLHEYSEPKAAVERDECVAVLIPARNEEENIGACVASVLASKGVAVEVVVLDDASTDRTAEIVQAMAAGDARVRVATSAVLPAGWNGKQHACWLLAQQVRAQPVAGRHVEARRMDAAPMLFLDADVRVEPEAIARCVAAMRARNVELLSGFPRQVVVGWLEQLLLPLIHFVLLGFLPMRKMRSTTKAAYAAGCGQFFLVERAPYFSSGGHQAIKGTRHDGLRLPQAMRRAGFRTDVVDLTALARVRMYESSQAVWLGLAKNATEGLGAPGRIVPLTLFLGAGQVLPVVATGLWCAVGVSSWIVGATFDEPGKASAVSAMLGLAVLCSYLPRLVAVRRFRQPWWSAAMHPAGVAALLGVQWYALGMQQLGRPVKWRARQYATGEGDS